MKRPLLFSRVLQFSILLCFLLPFFFLSCENKADESATETDSLTVDTVLTPSDRLSETHLDSGSAATLPTIDTTYSIETEEPTATIEKEESKEDYTGRLSKSLIEEYPWSKSLLIPEEAVYTGLALSIDIGQFTLSLGIYFSLCLFIICLLVKYIDPKAIKTQLLHNILALVFLLFYIPDFNYDPLWGYWICLTLIVLTITLDGLRLLSRRFFAG